MQPRARAYAARRVGCLAALLIGVAVGGVSVAQTPLAADRIDAGPGVVASDEDDLDAGAPAAQPSTEQNLADSWWNRDAGAAAVGEDWSPLEPDAGMSQAPAAAVPAAPDSALPVDVAAPEPAPAPAHEPATPADADSSAVARVVLGLLALLTLAYLGGHPRVQRVEHVLGISQVVTAGFPFIAFGLLARQPSVGILTDGVLAQLSSVLQLGLGWIGFLIGFRFDLGVLDRLSNAVVKLTALITGLSFLAVVLASSAALLAFGHEWNEAMFLRDATILGAAAAITVPPLIRQRIGRAATVDGGTLEQIAFIDDVAAIVALLILGAYFRPASTYVAWQLPGTAWLFVTLGLGGCLGALIYIVMRRQASAAESLVLLIGSIGFSAGMASYLRLSPIAVSFLVGLVVANLPGDFKRRMGQTLHRLERPLYLAFLVIAGAMWDVGDWRGWLLVPVFVTARFGGRALAVLWARRDGTEVALGQRELAVFAPMGSLAIAIVVSVQTLYLGRAIPWVVTAVIGGAIVTELVVQLVGRAERAP